MEGSTVSANQALLSDLEVLDGGYLAMSGRINGAATPPLLGISRPKQAAHCLTCIGIMHQLLRIHKRTLYGNHFPLPPLPFAKCPVLEDISLEHNCIQSYILCTLVINSNGQ